MNQIKMKFFINLLFFLFYLTPQSFSQSLHLKEAVNVALQNNLDLQMEKNRVELASIANHPGMAGGLPQVNASLNNQESMIGVNQQLNSGTIINRSGILSNNLNGNVAATWLLYNGNRVVATKKRLETLEGQSKSILNARIQNLLAAVIVSYFDVVRQQALLQSLQQSLQLSRQQVSILETKKSIGMSSESDRLQSQIDLQSIEQELLSQQAAVQQSKASLFRLLNWPADTTLVMSDTIAINPSLKMAEILSGIGAHPDVQSLDQQIRINTFLEKEMAALRKPSINTTAGVNYNRFAAGAGQFLLNQTYGPYIGLGIAIPIYNGGRLKRQEEMAKIRTQNARLEKDNLMEENKNLAMKMYQVYINGLEQIAKQRAICTLSEQLTRLTLQRFQLNAATIIEVREAQKSYQETAYRLQNLLYNIKLAETELLRLSNMLAI